VNKGWIDASVGLKTLMKGKSLSPLTKRNTVYTVFKLVEKTTSWKTFIRHKVLLLFTSQLSVLIPHKATPSIP
jgi:hypothetical protein